MITDDLFRLLTPASDWPKHILHLLVPIGLRSTPIWVRSTPIGCGALMRTLTGDFAQPCLSHTGSNSSF